MKTAMGVMGLSGSHSETTSTASLWILSKPYLARDQKVDRSFVGGTFRCGVYLVLDVMQ